jgi:hypothetical protein
VGAHASESTAVGDRGPLVSFDRFILWEEQGPRLETIAPALARHVYVVHRRVVMSDGLPPGIQILIVRCAPLTATVTRASKAVIPAERECPPTEPIYEWSIALFLNAALIVIVVSSLTIGTYLPSQKSDRLTMPFASKPTIMPLPETLNEHGVDALLNLGAC